MSWTQFGRRDFDFWQAMLTRRETLCSQSSVFWWPPVMSLLRLLKKKKQLRKPPQVNWKRNASVEMWYFPIVNVLSPSHNSRIKFIFHKIRYVFLSLTEDSKTMLAFISKQRGNASSEESVSQWRYFVSKDKFFSVYKHCYTICNIILLFILWLFVY